MSATNASARCINCKTDVREQDKTCRKCGDRVRPRARLEIVEDRNLSSGTAMAGDFSIFTKRVPPSHIDPSGAQEFVERLMGHPRTTAVQLTGQQADAIERVKDWYACRGIGVGPFRLFGPAGTGKTTIAKHIAQALGVDAVFGAYTGKAAHVLRKKGVPATTIHSAVYHPVDNYELRREWQDKKDALSELHEANIMGGPGEPGPMWHADVERLTQEIEQLEATMRRPGFEFNPYSEWAHADLIVLDEVSMVNTAMARDIEMYGVPVLVLGDPAQLPPIEGGGYYTRAEPDVLLTEVHRQALESPVYRLATEVREGRGWSSVPVSMAAAMEADQIICWKNSTRWSLIEKIRAKLGRPAGVPVPGDRIMCLVNNKDAGVLNGMQFDVLDVSLAALGAPACWMLRVRDDEGHEREVAAYEEGFQGLEQEKRGKDTLRAFRGARGLFTFANVVTCHKAQGSEWPHVYVVDQTHQMWKSTEAEKRAWMYTAASRASERVTVASVKA